MKNVDKYHAGSAGRFQNLLDDGFMPEETQVNVLDDVEHKREATKSTALYRALNLHLLPHKSARLKRSTFSTDGDSFIG